MDNQTSKFSPEEYSKVVRKLVTSTAKNSNNQLHFSGVSLLLAVNADLNLKVWGGESVDKIKKGNWRKCFAKPPEKLDVDPF